MKDFAKILGGLKPPSPPTNAPPAEKYFAEYCSIFDISMVKGRIDSPKFCVICQQLLKKIAILSEIMSLAKFLFAFVENKLV